MHEIWGTKTGTWVDARTRDKTTVFQVFVEKSKQVEVVVGMLPKFSYPLDVLL